jgi:hypothetical protein
VLSTGSDGGDMWDVENLKEVAAEVKKIDTEMSLKGYKTIGVAVGEVLLTRSNGLGRGWRHFTTRITSFLLVERIFDGIDFVLGGYNVPTLNGSIQLLLLFIKSKHLYLF